MTHHYEFIATLSDGRVLQMHYQGKTSRMSKVDKLIRADITRSYGIDNSHITSIKMRPLTKEECSKLLITEN